MMNPAAAAVSMAAPTASVMTVRNIGLRVEALLLLRPGDWAIVKCCVSDNEE
jgi:hypothetical protein